MQEVGCPEPAAVVAIIERMLSRRARSLTPSTMEADGTATGVAPIIHFLPQMHCSDFTRFENAARVAFQSFPVSPSRKPRSGPRRNTPVVSGDESAERGPLQPAPDHDATPPLGRAVLGRILPK